MTPVRYYVIPREDVEHVTQDSPIPGDFLTEWESVRPGVLGKLTQDIFAENCRSENQAWKDFSLFQRVRLVENAEVVVCQNWLELRHHQRLDNRLLIQHVLSTYPNQIKIFSWNHDADSRSVSMFGNLTDDSVILDYNTSRPWPQSLVLPFWNVATGMADRTDRPHFAGFNGYIGSVKLRQQLRFAIHRQHGYHCSDRRLSEAEYLKQLGSFHYALCPRGGGLSSYRFYEAIQCGTVPVLFADDAVLPFPELDYSKFSIHLPESATFEFWKIDDVLRAADWESLHREVLVVQQQFSLLGVQRSIHAKVRGILG